MMSPLGFLFAFLSRFHFYLCYSNENSSKLLIKISRFYNKVVHCLLFLFQRASVFSENEEQKSQMTSPFSLSHFYQTENYYHSLHHVFTNFNCMRPEVNSNWFEISNHFEKSFRLHGNFTAAACK